MSLVCEARNIVEVVLERSSRIPVVMGVLNVTPDSFSDGGRYVDPGHAVRHGLRMIDDGAEIIDVGGESTRPGSEPVEPEEQIRRILPVIIGLSRKIGRSSRLISVDTSASNVADRALAAGANLVNDVSAGTVDPSMFPVVARHSAGIALMHMQGVPRNMQDGPSYNDVVEEVATFLEARAEVAIGAGIARDRIILDPGIGFGKTKADNLRLLSSLERLVKIGYPVLLGTSRKRFMGSICAESSPQELVGATIATTVLGYSKGVRLFRVHDVRHNRQALDVAAAIQDSRSS